MNELITSTTKMLSSVNMRDARKFFFLGMAITGIVEACNRYSTNVMNNGYELNFSVGKFVKVDLKKHYDNQQDVIDVIPNNS